jgi:transcriptional regulator with XRE-family HTH domain
MRRAVADIRRAGYTARDAGVLLGVSNQRISQIERQIAGSDAQKVDRATLEDAE